MFVFDKQLLTRNESALTLQLQFNVPLLKLSSPHLTFNFVESKSIISVLNYL
jgi:hypothetical protein